MKNERTLICEKKKKREKKKSGRNRPLPHCNDSVNNFEKVLTERLV